MAMWRCPHCGTPQAETARCWVCRQSSTTCSTCRNFQRSLAPNVGFCGLDRRRLPLTGAELRGCWATAAALPDTSEAPPLRTTTGDPGRRLRGFVPVEDLVLPRRSAANAPATTAPAASAIESMDGWLNRATLFGDAEA